MPQSGQAGRDKAAGQVSMERAGRSGCKGQVARLELLTWAHSQEWGWWELGAKPLMAGFISALPPL